jgi:hypothetical protein
MGKEQGEAGNGGGGIQAGLLVECFQGMFGRGPRQLVDAR